MIATWRPLRRSVARKMEAMPLRATSVFNAVVVELIAGMEWLMQVGNAGSDGI